MSLRTFSKFYYGQNIDDTNYALDFSEGGPQLAATLDIGDYSLSTLMTEVASEMNSLGGQVYTVTVDRASRFVTISAPADFEMLVATGDRVGSDVFSLLGFTGTDRTGASTYTGNMPCGEVYFPQFVLQDHIATDDYQMFIDPNVSVSSSGQVEVVKFGTEKFMECNIKYATNEQHPAIGPIENNPTGLDDLRDFLEYAITKSVMEYMPDRNDSATFEIMLLESTEGSPKGTGFKLKEQYGEGLPRHFETGTLKFRKVG